MPHNLLSYKASIVGLALAVGLVVMVPNVSQAAYLRAQPIYVENSTTHPIWVAARFMPPGTHCFVSDGYWLVAPGQTVRVAYNHNRYIYFYARDDSGNVWDGNATHATIRGERLGMAKYDTGMCFDPWTITFGP